MDFYRNSLKMYINILFIYCACVLVDGNQFRRTEGRNGRLFSFNTVDNDITVSMDFTVPFLSIPVKKTLNDAFGDASLGLPTININPASLALGGILVIGSVIFVPLLLKNYASEYPQQRYAKLLNNVHYSADTVLDFTTQMLESRSLYGCSQRVACWTGQNTDNGEMLKIWSHIMSNQLLSNMFNTTAIAEAMTMGRHGLDCLTYSPCPLQENHLPMLMKNFGRLTKPIL